ncbi:MAG TPA: YdeI/OmpD-associated family protein [Thermoanaerobaculia bacterium]|jgi:uncharacterized protein YdeI (YjbR/CyaY-like superfamily)|nr:YdeI/OmpD-associated family protein [Thermoanaerobaculia bacterium]
MKLAHPSTRADWRAWLTAHHDRETEIWLVYNKRHTGEPRVEYGDAVEEALCFGWIDSIVRTIDADRYAQKFTPRKAKSKWSELNKRRFAKMVAEGKMTAAGLAKSPPEDAGGAGAKPPEDDAVPGYIEAALRANGVAWTNFSNFAPSYRRLYVRWIEDAKKEETRRKRLAEAVGLLEQNKKLGLK